MPFFVVWDAIKKLSLVVKVDEFGYIIKMYFCDNYGK